MLDADAPTNTGEFEPHTLSIEVEDRPGVLNQVWPAKDAQRLSTVAAQQCSVPGTQH